MTRSDPILTLLEHRLIVCCGSGGVGKTTVAAALALRAAREGKRALVLTIDPARRLADSLGVGKLGNDEVPIPSHKLHALGLRSEGELWALMLDPKRTFDGLVDRFSPTTEIRDRILNNRYYQQISASMVGSQEYMAMERLLDVRESERYDVIILDTPPSRHALDFLNAPSRLLGVLDEGVLSWLLKPSSMLITRLQKRLVGSREGGMLQTLERVLGLTMLGDLSEFVISFKDLLGGFRLRAEKTARMLVEEQTCFLLVTSPNTLAVREADFFRAQLRERELHFGGYIINRALPLSMLRDQGAELEAIRRLPSEAWRALFPAEVPEGLSPERYQHIVETLRVSLEGLLQLAEIDRGNLDWLLARAEGQGIFLQLPELPGDIHDLLGLDLLGRLMSAAQPRS